MHPAAFGAFLLFFAVWVVFLTLAAWARFRDPAAWREVGWWGRHPDATALAGRVLRNQNPALTLITLAAMATFFVVLVAIPLAASAFE